MEKHCRPEIWGGIECSINRVQDNFFNQLDYSPCNNFDRYIDAISGLCIKKLRYPVLWEKHHTEPEIDWKDTEKKLALFKQQNIDVIAGLVHHGSGPAYTNLLDKDFALHLSKYAKTVAKKFPELQYYTPVNEPLTTARFSGLYGLWYPHKKDPRAFIQMLLNQCKGIALAMKEIRKINPAAQLVQTEDLCKVYSTAALKYQADFENERRWLTYDLLCGNVNKDHALWNYLRYLKIEESDLLFFEENICIPQVFGFNYYVTSERFLDERLHLYPKHTHGTNAKHSYADVEAARVMPDEEWGIEKLLIEAWERYHQPLTITEVHLHCHREEQLRWFHHIYSVAKKLNEGEVRVNAITAWALFGSYGWNKLLTQPGGDYEPGVFDVTNDTIRPTALAHYIKKLCLDDEAAHPVCNEKGWWQRSDRLIYHSKDVKVNGKTFNAASPVLIIGKRGTLGKAFKKICDERSLHSIVLGREDCDISERVQVEHAIHRYKPWAVINAAGYVRVDEAEYDARNCFRENTTAAHHLALACEKSGIKLLSFSSDLVFDGTKKIAYTENDLVNPLNVYGQSKAMAEHLIKQENKGALIIRTSAFFSAWDEYNFVYNVYKQLSKGELFYAAKDIIISPTYVPDLVHASLDLLIDDAKGIWHLANEGKISWADLALFTAGHLGLNRKNIVALKADEMKFSARRPLFGVLKSEKGVQLPKLEDALHRCFKQFSAIESLLLHEKLHSPAPAKASAVYQP